jgi:hypothetical protein
MQRSAVASRRTIRAGVVALFVVVSSTFTPVAQATNDPRGTHVIFTQQDAVQAFDLVTGKGYQTGTAIGLVSGTTLVEFQFTVVGPPVGDALPISFHNEVTVTDIDGDQIFFDNDGTGTFHLGVPGAPFQGSGGPLSGKYVVTGGTGKYSKWKVGTTFKYRAVATNPPAPPNRLGNVYVEVSARR